MYSKQTLSVDNLNKVQIRHNAEFYEKLLKEKEELYPTMSLSEFARTKNINYKNLYMYKFNNNMVESKRNNIKNLLQEKDAKYPEMSLSSFAKMKGININSIYSYRSRKGMSTKYPIVLNTVSEKPAVKLKKTDKKVMDYSTPSTPISKVACTAVVTIEKPSGTTIKLEGLTIDALKELIM